MLKTRLLAVGAPAELKARLFGRRIVVTLARPAPGLPQVLNLPFVRSASSMGPSSSWPWRSPSAITLLVRRLVELGAEILYVEEEERTLEEVYLELVEGDRAA